MTDQVDTQETSVEATPAARTRAPALVAMVEGVAHKLLKYAFPTKAVAFSVTVNGVEAQAATTAGRGASYTYLLINNTGFYLPKNVLLEAGSEVTIDFPESYKFDDEQAVRVSTYKPKAKRVAPTDGSDDGSEESADAADGAEGTLFGTRFEYPVEETAPKAKRRGRK